MRVREGRTTRRAAPLAKMAEAGIAEAGIAGEADHDSMSVATGKDMEPAGGIVTRVGYAPIVRLDATRRELELCATSEAVDSYGTVFDYTASKDAFTRWIGNVREMHERRAVGRRVGVRFDDATRKIYVTIRISRGARDTWEKVVDGTLRGASIGASHVDWQETLWLDERGNKVMVAKGYDLVELSLVDNPSNPDALGFTFVRDATPDLALLDRLEEGDFDAKDAKETQREKTLNHRGYGGHRDATEEAGRARRGAAASDDRRPVPSVQGQPAIPALGDRRAIPALKGRGTEMGHECREASGSQRMQRGAADRRSSAIGEIPDGGAMVSGRLHEAARALLAGCGCALCEAALAVLGEGNAAAEAMEADETRENETRGSGAEASRVREAALVRALGASLRTSTERLARLDEGMRDLREALAAGTSQMGGQVGHFAERMTSATEEFGRRIERLEAQPLPGGPAARPAEKTHALHTRSGGWAGPVSLHEQYRALEALAGRLADPQAQIAVAAELIRLQREGSGA